MELAVQLYTVRDAIAQDLEATLGRLADLGLKWVELAGTGGKTPEEFGGILTAKGLRACSAHVGLDELETSFDDSAAMLKTVGAGYAAVPWIDIKQHSDPVAFAAKLSPIADKLAESGVELSYHNHAFELDGEKPLWLDRLFGASDPGRLKAQLDLGWIQVSGQDPVAYIQRYANRLPTVHLKDYSGDPAKHDALAGEGWLDWDSILPACEAAGVKFGMIEMDVPPGDPVEAVGKCIEFFRSKGIA